MTSWEFLEMHHAMGVGHWFFFLCHLFYATPQKFSIFYATLFYATQPNFYATHFMPSLNFEKFMPPFFMPPWIFLGFKEKFEIQDGKSTCSTHFFYRPRFFFMPPLFMPPSRKLKSLCHPLFMPPSKILCHPFYATPGWHRKKGGGGGATPSQF